MIHDLSPLARIAGATVKAVRHFDFVESGKRVDNFALDTGKIDYAAEVRRLLKNTDFVIGADARRFHEVKSDLLDHFGMNTMNCLCRGEIDRFINRLNHGLGMKQFAVNSKELRKLGYNIHAIGKCVYSLEYHDFDSIVVCNESRGLIQDGPLSTVTSF